MKNSKVNVSEMASVIAEYELDPLGFVYFAFPWNESTLSGKDGLEEWQREYLDDLGKRLRSGQKLNIQEETSKIIRKATASGHGIGKSALVSWLMLWAISTHEDTKGIVTANTETQLKTKTWAELSKWHNLFIGRDLFEMTATALFSTEPKHEKTWRIDMVPWSERNTEAFAGLHNQGKRIILIFDEASAIPDSIWEVSEGALTDLDTQIIWCVFGNPTRNIGKFRDCFGKLSHRWATQQIDSRDVSITNKAQIKEWETDYGEDSDFFRVRVRGVFPSASDNQFIASGLVDSAVKVALRKEQYQFEPVIIGVDPAWTGSDAFVVYLRQGLYTKLLASWAKNDNDFQMAERIAGFEDEYNADAVFIDFGYGTGVYSAGITLGRSWQLINFSESPEDPLYLNKRAEMWGRLREWLKSGGHIPPNDLILQSDLNSPECYITDRGKLRLESKEDMKRRGIPSPNNADALALTFARPVQSRFGKYSSRRVLAEVMKEYDPFQAGFH